MDGSLPDPFRAAAAARNDTLDALESELFELWGHINAATYRFLELVAEFDRLEGWVRHGVASCAQWLSWQCPEVGTLVRNALDAAIGALEKRQDESEPVETQSRVSAGTPRLTDDSPTSEEEPFTVGHRFGAKRADALALLAQSFLNRESDNAGSVADRHQVVVHIEQRLLANRPIARALKSRDAPAASRVLFERHRAAGRSIDADTARCRWLGDRLDYGLVIEYLFNVRNRRRAAQAAVKTA